MKIIVNFLDYKHREPKGFSAISVSCYQVLLFILGIRSAYFVKEETHLLQRLLLF